MAGFGVASGAAIAQWRDDPTEWGQGGEGLGRRLAHRIARSTVRETCESAGAALLRHDVRYIPSRDTRFLPRVTHAVGANFVTLDRNGNRVFHTSRLAGILAGVLVSRYWMPDRYGSTYRISRGIGIQLGISSAYNVLREFTPDLKRALHRR
ncbi:MAG: hypothetical protein LLG20_06420 [Acidobacteriales bacterium]|nr:hypothetical protein [Terriglobales bacterium]